MTKLGFLLAGFGFLALRASAGSQTSQIAPPSAENALVKQYCASCHNDRTKTGGLSLAAFDLADMAAHPAVAEKMIHKVRAGMMPPPGARRPDEPALIALVEALESRIDKAAALNPNPG